jgi:hypothetical protein
MKVDLGLYRHMLTREYYDFARRCSRRVPKAPAWQNLRRGK